MAMRGVRNYLLEFTGSAQRLSTALVDTTVGGPDDVPFCSISIQPDGANGAACYLGGEGVTALTGIYLPAGAAGVPPPPIQIELGGRAAKLSSFYVIGTATQKLRIMGVEP